MLLRDGDELVVFEGSQTQPLFLLYTTEFDRAKERMTFSGAEKKAGEDTTAPKGWSFLNQGSGEEEG